MNFIEKIQNLFTEDVVNVFVVDDSPTFALAQQGEIERSFPNKPINVYSFSTVDTCMNKFSEVNPQVVILDYHMDGRNPGEANGIIILDRIKKENEATNVILLTGDDHLNIAIKAFKHGASDYIVKSETQSVKLKNALVNAFRMIDSMNETKKYQHLLALAGIIGGLFIGALAATLLFAPEFLKGLNF